MNPENDLVLLEMGTRITRLEELVTQLCHNLHLITPMVATLQEQTLYRVREMNKKNG